MDPSTYLHLAAGCAMVTEMHIRSAKYNDQQVDVSSCASTVPDEQNDSFFEKEPPPAQTQTTIIGGTATQGSSSSDRIVRFVEEKQQKDVPKGIKVEKQKDNKRKSPRLIEQERQRAELESYKMSNKLLGTFVNRSTSLKGKISGKRLILAWVDIQKLSLKWMLTLQSKTPVMKAAFHAFFVNSLNVIQKTMNSAKPRPPEVHEAVLQFIVDICKIYEIGISRGIKEIVGTLSRILETLLGHHLAKPQTMGPLELQWIQTRNAIELLISTPKENASIYAFIQLLGKMQIYFVNTWTCRQAGYDKFIAFALTQFADFQQILANRLNVSERDKQYNI